MVECKAREEKADRENISRRCDNPEGKWIFDGGL
jgi:hypothetical protein